MPGRGRPANAGPEDSGDDTPPRNRRTQYPTDGREFGIYGYGQTTHPPTLTQRARAAELVITDYLRTLGRPGRSPGDRAVRLWRALTSGTREAEELDESAYGDAAADVLHHATAAGYSADPLCAMAYGLHATRYAGRQPSPKDVPDEHAYVLASLLADIYDAAEADAAKPAEDVEASARLHHDAEQAEAQQCPERGGPRELCPDCQFRDSLSKQADAAARGPLPF